MATPRIKELPKPAPSGAWRQAANLMDAFLALRDIRKMFVSPYVEHIWLVYPFASPGIPQDPDMDTVMFHGVHVWDMEHGVLWCVQRVG